MTKKEFKHEVINALYNVLDKIPENADVDGDIKFNVRVKVPKGENPPNEDEEDLY